MSFKQEITQLCKTILFFQLELKDKKQTLFSDNHMIPEYVFKAIFTGLPNNLPKSYYTRQLEQQKYKCFKNQQYQNDQCLNIDNLIIFLQKHGVNCYKISDLVIFLNSYSSKSNKLLTLHDLWEVFTPRTQNFIEQIVQVRRNKHLSSMVKCEQIHYKLMDLIIQLLCKSIQFEVMLDQMKRNVLQVTGVSKDLTSLNISPINSKNFQLYLNQYAQDLSIKDAQIILKVICKNKNHSKQIMTEKVFYDFFIPYQHKQIQICKINPNQKYKLNENTVENRLYLSALHQKAARYAKKSNNKKKPIYLQ